MPYRVGTYPGYVAGGAVGAAICLPIALRSGDYGGCAVQMADGISNAVGTVLASPFAALEWGFYRGPRRLFHQEKPAPGLAAPPPAGLMFEVAPPPNARLLGGLAGPLRLEPGETMTHALEHDGTATPVTFGYDAAKRALTVDDATFPLKPPYPQKLRVTVGGVPVEVSVTPIAP